MSMATVPETDEVDPVSETEKPKEYQIELPGFEDHRVTELRLNFSGNTLVSDPDMAEALKLDGEVELVVRGRVVSATHRAGRDAGGTKVAKSAAVYVESVELAE